MNTVCVGDEWDWRDTIDPLHTLIYILCLYIYILYYYILYPIGVRITYNWRIIGVLYIGTVNDALIV